MKTNQKGSTVPLLIIIIIILLVGGVYLYSRPMLTEPTPAPNVQVQTSTTTDTIDQTQTTPNSDQSIACGLKVTSLSAGAVVSFPLTVKGVVDNRKANNTDCSMWQMFEGQAGSAQLYFNANNQGWKKLGGGVPVKVDDWMTNFTSFNTTLTFNNGGIGLPDNTPMKITFSEENASGMGKVDTVDFPIIFNSHAAQNVTVATPAPLLTDKQISDSIIADSKAGGNNVQKVSDTKYNFVDGRGSITINSITRGDLNGDKTEDAIVQGTWCSASCGGTFLIVLNQNGSTLAVAAAPEGMELAGYKQVQIKKVSIARGLVSITTNDGTKDSTVVYKLVMNPDKKYLLVQA